MGSLADLPIDEDLDERVTETTEALANWFEDDDNDYTLPAPSWADNDDDSDDEGV